MIPEGNPALKPLYPSTLLGISTTLVPCPQTPQQPLVIAVLHPSLPPSLPSFPPLSDGLTEDSPYFQCSIFVYVSVVFLTEDSLSFVIILWSCLYFICFTIIDVFWYWQRTPSAGLADAQLLIFTIYFDLGIQKHCCLQYFRILGSKHIVYTTFEYWDPKILFLYPIFVILVYGMFLCLVYSSDRGLPLRALRMQAPSSTRHSWRGWLFLNPRYAVWFLVCYIYYCCFVIFIYVVFLCCPCFIPGMAGCSNVVKVGIEVGHSVKDHHTWPYYLPLLKKTCVRRVVLDKWFPLNGPCVCVYWTCMLYLCVYIYIYIYIYNEQINI